MPASERHFTGSLLTGEKFVEVYTEAHLLAFQIQSNGRTKAAQAAQSKDPGRQEVEGFIQESKLKINLFDRENKVKKSPKSLKRETYCLSDDLWRASLLRGTQPASSAAPPAAPAQTSRGRRPPHALLCRQSPVLLSLRTRPGLRRRSSASYCRPEPRPFEERAFTRPWRSLRDRNQLVLPG